MKRSIVIASFAATQLLSACEKKNEAAAPPESAAKAEPGEAAPAAAAPAGATADAAARQTATQALQARLDSLGGKVDALKANPKAKEQSATLTAKLDAARAELKALGDTTDATWNDAKAKAEKTLQELEATVEQARGAAGG